MWQILQSGEEDLLFHHTWFTSHNSTNSCIHAASCFDGTSRNFFWSAFAKWQYFYLSTSNYSPSTEFDMTGSGFALTLSVLKATHPPNEVGTQRKRIPFICTQASISQPLLSTNCGQVVQQSANGPNSNAAIRSNARRTRCSPQLFLT